jgi:hypothetical protein
MLNEINNIDIFYKDIDKLVINKYINNNLKNLLELSTVTDLYVFTKKKNIWKLKDKRQLLKECDYKRKQKIKEVSTILTKNKLTNIKEIKLKNENLLNDIEKIDNLIDTIEKNYSPNTLFIESYSN